MFHVYVFIGQPHFNTVFDTQEQVDEFLNELQKSEWVNVVHPNIHDQQAHIQTKHITAVVVEHKPNLASVSN